MSRYIPLGNISCVYLCVSMHLRVSMCACICVCIYWLSDCLCTERVGLDNIENGFVCDFGDNALDYMTTLSSRVVESDSSDSDHDGDDDYIDDNDDMIMPDDVSVGDDENNNNDVLSDLLSDDFVAFLQS